MDQDEDALGSAVGRRLRAVRERRGLSQEELAERAGAGLSTRTIGNIERGRTRPHRHTIEAVAGALGMTANERAALLAAWQAEAAPTGLRTSLEGQSRSSEIRRDTPAASGNLNLPSPTSRSNLPVALTSFVGRDREVIEVRDLLTDSPVVTLTGSGGCGKTRLALQVAANCLDAFLDGVWLVELAPVTDPLVVPQAIANVLGVREVPSRPLVATLADYLHNRQALLLIDNCEHLVEVSAHTIEVLLRACRRLRILATSRERLGVAGEVTWRVPSLSFVDPRSLKLGADDMVRAVLDSEAGRLFVARSRLASPSFAVTEANALAVAEVCQRLDGIPLALELAAARTAVLSMDQIASRLDQRLRLLSGGRRTALPRQQTMRAAIDWSYELLSGDERVLLHRLAVFVGGWSLEAAEAITAGGSIEAGNVLDLLGQLVAKSIVVAEESHLGDRRAVRYRLLETEREYAVERLSQSGEEAEVRRAHAALFLALAERAVPELTGPREAEWLDRLELEHENLRAAVEWLVEDGDVARGLRFGATLRQYWLARGYLSEGRARLEALLALPDVETNSSAADVLAAAAMLTYRQGDNATARSLATRELALRRQRSDQTGTAGALHMLGVYARAQGDLDAAEGYLNESLGLFSALGDQASVSSVLDVIGTVAHAGGDHERARARYAEALAIAEKVGNLGIQAWGPYNVGLLALDQGDYSAARAWLGRSAAAWQRLGEKPWMVNLTIAVACLASAEGWPELAIRLGVAASRIARSLGITVAPIYQARFERWLDAARQAAGPERAEAAAVKGSALTLDAALRAALNHLEQ